MDYSHLAEILDQAVQAAEPVPQLSASYAINLSDAYKIQDLVVQRCLLRGERVVGMKLGFTSKAKMKQMGVKDLIWGTLTDRMAIKDGGKLPAGALIHPRAEPEIAFRICQDINQSLRSGNLREYVDGVAVAIEVIDSRYRNFQFSLEDVVADNCSSAGFVIGTWHKADTPIQDLNIQMRLDDQLVETGRSSAILGNPWDAMLEATRLAQAYGRTIKSGEIILAGAATAAVYLKDHRHVQALAEGLGTVNLSID